MSSGEYQDGFKEELKFIMAKGNRDGRSSFYAGAPSISIPFHSNVTQPIHQPVSTLFSINNLSGHLPKFLRTQCAVKRKHRISRPLVFP